MAESPAVTVPPDPGASKSLAGVQLGCSEATVDRLIRAGRLDVVRVGKRVWITPESIAAVLAGQR